MTQRIRSSTNNSRDNKDEGSGGAAAGKENHPSLLQNPQSRQNIHDISKLLNTGLTAEALDICVKLLENGVHPEFLADMVRDMRPENHQGAVSK